MTRASHPAALRSTRIRKVLVANRGEIAVRIVRGLRDMGLVSAVLYSDADRTGLAVLLADEAYRIGLVQELVEPGTQLDRAIEIAETIAKLAPLAVRATKASSIQYLVEGETATISGFAAAQQKLAQSEDAAEGLKSFVERREGNFTGK